LNHHKIDKIAKLNGILAGIVIALALKEWLNEVERTGEIKLKLASKTK